MPVAPRTWIWILAASAAICLAPGRMALTDPDEARYAQTSREMLRGGDLVVPRFNGEPRLSKPPMIHWAQAAAFSILGESETAARLPSLLAALAILVLAAWWAERRLGAGTGGPAAAVMATCLIFFVCARLAIIDMMLCLFVTAALLAWETATAPGARYRRALAWAGSAAIGLAALAKGPVGPALAAAIVLICALATRAVARLREPAPDPVDTARRAITLRGVALAAAGILALAGPWIIVLTRRVGTGNLLDLLRRETVERSLFGLDHPRPFYYFAATFWVTFLPWSLALPVILWRALRPAARSRDPLTLFLLCWLLGTLLFFSLSTDKNDAWLLPAAPPLALLAARCLPRRAVLIVSMAVGPLLAAGVLWLSDPISRDRSLKDLALAARLPEQRDAVLIAYKLYRPSLVWYADHPVRWVSSGRELRQLLSSTPDDSLYLVMTEPRWAKLRVDSRFPLHRLEQVGEQAGMTLLVHKADVNPNR